MEELDLGVDGQLKQLERHVQTKQEVLNNTADSTKAQQERALSKVDDEIARIAADLLE